MDQREEGLLPLERRVAIRHQRGQLTAQERIELLFDPGSFVALDLLREDERPAAADFDGEGLIIGCGLVNGRPVYGYANDMMLRGGSMSAAHARKIAALYERAVERHAPVIGLHDSLGIRLQDGLAALAGLGEIYRGSIEAAGRIPRISVIMGPCAGGEALLAGLSDFIFMLRENATLFVTAPDVVEAARFERIGAAELGGAMVHGVKSGNADGIYDNEVEALLEIRRFLDFLPLSYQDGPPRWDSFDDAARVEASLDSLVPDAAERAYDAKELILKVLDENDFFELQPAHAANILTGFGRLDGATVGVVANQPLVQGGVLDIDAAGKAARFIRFCGSFDIPIVSFVDVAGFLPGAAQEHGGLVRAGADLLHAYATARSPKITLVVRNAFGAAAAMMGSKPLCDATVFAWPSAAIGLKRGAGTAEPRTAADAGLIDAVIAPRETRPHLVRALASWRVGQR